ncbi:MAG: hypothetical protein HOE90_06535 [Bacteriovoracaceae bacterium]|nr:hypothetical protein [Bacteriovoracaceae bacterium]
MRKLVLSIFILNILTLSITQSAERPKCGLGARQDLDALEINPLKPKQVYFAIKDILKKAHDCRVTFLEANNYRVGSKLIRCKNPKIKSKKFHQAFVSKIDSACGETSDEARCKRSFKKVFKKIERVRYSRAKKRFDSCKSHQDSREQDS